MVSLVPVAHVLGLMVCGLGATMMVPMLLGLVDHDSSWPVFAVGAALNVYVGGTIALLSRGAGSFSLDVRQAFVLTGACWVVLPVMGATPFLGFGLDVVDSIFESVSGITTTGSTVMTNLDDTPHDLLLWRSLLQWVGGVGIIVMAIVLLPFLRVGGMQLFQTESSGPSEKIVPKAFHLVRWIVGVYVSLTLLCMFGFLGAGMSGFDALCHAMTTLSTGGYSTHDASFGYFQNPAAHWIAILFMAAGALPFVEYLKAAKRNPGAFVVNPQCRGLAIVLVGAGGAMALWLTLRDGIPIHDALRLTLFNVTSVVTTTGFANADYTTWGPPAAGAFFILTFVGGCAGSTAGGIKIYRFQILWLIIKAHLLRLSRPRRVVVPTYGGTALQDDIPMSVLAFLALFMGSVGLIALLLSLMGLDIVTALSASATAVANVGPGLGTEVGPAGTFADLPDPAKLLLAVAMLLGRLEFFSLLLMLDPRFWRP